MNALDVIEKFCEINQRVALYLGNQENAQCFCGAGWQGGLLENVERAGLEENGYRHDGKTIEFVNAAITEKIMRGREERGTVIRGQPLESLNADLSIQALKRENEELHSVLRSKMVELKAVMEAHNRLIAELKETKQERDAATEARDKANDVVEDISAFCRERNGFFASYHAAKIFADVLIERFLPNYRDANQGQNTVSE